MTDARYSDEDLVAYDDGEMAAETAAQLAVDLAGDAHLRARLDTLLVDRDALGAAFQDLLDQAPDPIPADCAPPETVIRLPRRSGWQGWAVAACLVLAMAGGALGYRVLAPAPALNWQQLAAAYHALYTTQTLLALPEPDAATASVQLTRSSEALGHSISETLTDIPGLSFRRAQVLGHDGTAIIQLAYLDDKGVPYAFCLRAAEGKPGQPMTAQGFAGVQGVEWRAGGIEYVLLGKRPLPELQALADIFRGKV